MVHLILPLTVVVLSHLWYYAYLIRNRLAEEIRSDYVLLAKSKGQSRGKILLGHCLRNVLPAYLSIMAISVPPYHGRNVYCGGGFFLSGPGNIVLRKRPVSGL